MKINFTKAEYRTLVEMLTIADWVLGSKYTDKEATHKKYHDLRNKILSEYKEFGAESFVEAGSDKNEYHETDALLNYVHDNFMDNYDDKVFWDELIYKLALRDVLKEIGVDKYAELEPLERSHKVGDAKQIYVDNFEQHGIENVIIKLSTEK